MAGTSTLALQTRAVTNAVEVADAQNLAWQNPKIKQVLAFPDLVLATPEEVRNGPGLSDDEQEQRQSVLATYKLLKDLGYDVTPVPSEDLYQRLRYAIEGFLRLELPVAFNTKHARLAPPPRSATADAPPGLVLPSPRWSPDALRYRCEAHKIILTHDEPFYPEIRATQWMSCINELERIFHIYEANIAAFETRVNAATSAKELGPSYSLVELEKLELGLQKTLVKILAQKKYMRERVSRMASDDEDFPAAANALGLAVAKSASLNRQLTAREEQVKKISERLKTLAAPPPAPAPSPTPAPAPTPVPSSDRPPQAATALGVA